jgi:hypothetical protein
VAAYLFYYNTAKAQDTWPHYFLQPCREKWYFHFGYRLRPQNVTGHGHVDYTLRVLRSLAISTAIRLKTGYLSYIPSLANITIYTGELNKQIPSIAYDICI